MLCGEDGWNSSGHDLEDRSLILRVTRREDSGYGDITEQSRPSLEALPQASSIRMKNLTYALMLWVLDNLPLDITLN